MISGVFVLTSGHGYGSSNFEGVFQSRKGAEARRDFLLEDGGFTPDELWIEFLFPQGESAND